MESESFEKNIPEEFKNFEEGTEEIQFLCLIIKDFNDNYIRYEIINSSVVQEIRKFLLDIPLTCFITNYDLVVQKTGRKLEDDESLFAVGIKEFDVIEMVPCLYTQTSIDVHVQRLMYIMQENTPYFNKSINNEHISRDLEALIVKSREFLGKGAEKQDSLLRGTTNLTEKTDLSESKENVNSENKDNKAKEEVAKDTKEGKTEKSKNKMNKLENVEEMKDIFNNYTETKQKISEMNFKLFRFSNLPESVVYEENPKPKKFTCLLSLFDSVYSQLLNKPDSDFKYIEVTTLEENKYFITCNERGFYLNSSTHDSFNPKPLESTYSSYTLAGLLSQISGLFRENYVKLISQSVDTEPFLNFPREKNSYDWLSKRPNESIYNYRFTQFDFKSSNEKNILLNKEWNEEYQAIFDLNFNEPTQTLTKEKLLADFYNQFKETAIEGAKLISEKKLNPFNFFENKSSGYYMYGNIFLTVLEDSYTNFKTFNKDNQNQTVLGASLDLRHISYLNSIKYELENKDFYFSLCCIVQYKGLNVHAQVITPGIIFNSEHLVEYGDVEEGKIKFNEDFHSALEKFNQKLNIKTNVIVDKEGKEFKMSGNPEIKGVRGVDKRKYLFDLIHLLPRDTNYLGNDNNGCLLRPELINEYKMKLISDKLSKDHAEEITSITKEIESLSQTAKDPKSYTALLEEKLKKKEEIYIKIDNFVKNSFSLNTCLYTESNLSNKSEDLEQDKEFLNKLSTFLKEEVLVKFLNENAREDENPICDSKTLSEAVHKSGINLRYYGDLIRLIESDKKYAGNWWLRSLIIQDVICRSAKHIFNSIVKDCPEHIVKAFTSYFLSVLVGSKSLLKYLDQYELTYSNGAFVELSKAAKEKVQVKEDVAKHSDDKNKKKKKGKGKKNKSKASNVFDYKFMITETLNSKTLSSLVEPPHYEKIFLKPLEIFEKIREVAMLRYGYDIFILGLYEYADPFLNRYALLRDFCKKSGIQIEAAEYNLYQEINSTTKTDFIEKYLIFHPYNILGFYPVVKEYTLPTEIHKNIFEQAENYFRSGNYLPATEKYRQAIYLSNEVYGPINKYSAIAHRRLGQISYFDGDYILASLMLQKSVIINEKRGSFDTSFLANSYGELATFYHLINQDYLAFKYIYKTMEILNFVYPANHPDLINRVCNLAMFFVDLDLVEKARDYLDSCMMNFSKIYPDTDRNLQRGWLLLSNLSLKCFNVSKALTSYEKYYNIIKANSLNEQVISNGEKVLNGLRLAGDEWKKKQTLFKNKDDSRKFYEEICKKHINPMFWDDLEKPAPKYFFDTQDPNILNYLVKNGLIKIPK